MEKYSGVINKLGSASVNKAAHHYSLVEIGGQVIQGKYISNALENYLRSAFNGQGNATLWVLGNKIVGVKCSDGKTYVSRYKLGGGDWFLMFASIPFMLVLIGFVIFALPLGKLIGAKRYNRKIAGIAEPEKVQIDAIA